MIRTSIRSSIRQPIVKSLRGENIDILHGVTPDIVTPPWVNEGGGLFSIDGSQTGSSTRIAYNSVLKPNTTYIFTVLTTGSTAGGVRPTITDYTPSFTSGNTSTEFIIENISDLALNVRANANYDGEITFTLREA